MKTVVIGQNIDVKNAIYGSLVEECDFDAHLVDYNQPICNDDVALLQTADFIILDLTTVKTNAILLISEIKEVFPKPKIIALNIYKEISLVNPIMKAGVSAYLIVETSSGEICEALSVIQSGGTYVSPEVA